ncbi:MAG: hypothetical protein AB7S26_08145 [Sandaracinaceae bacterium]
MSRRTDPPPPRKPKEPKKTLGEVVSEVVKGVLDAIDDLVAPPPRLVPIPIRRRR